MFARFFVSTFVFLAGPHLRQRDYRARPSRGTSSLERIIRAPGRMMRPLAVFDRSGAFVAGLPSKLENTVKSLFRKVARAAAVAAVVVPTYLNKPASAQADCQEVVGEHSTGVATNPIPDPFAAVYDGTRNSYLVTSMANFGVYSLDTTQNGPQFFTSLRSNGRGIAIGGGYLWVLNWINEIEQKDLVNGVTLIPIGLQGGSGNCYGLAWNSEKNSLLAYDLTNQTINQYSTSGALMGSIHIPNLDDGIGIAVRPMDNHIFISRDGNNNFTELRLTYDSNNNLNGFNYNANHSYFPAVATPYGISYRNDIGQLVLLDDGGAASIITVNDGRCQPGDVNGDGFVNFNDVQPFTEYLLGTHVPPYNQADDYMCDMNGDGNLDGLDIQPFVNRLLNP